VPDDDAVPPPSPDIHVPLSTEALRSADEMLQERLRQAPSPSIGTAKRPPGRPPGSKNKPKDTDPVKPNGARISVPRGAAARVDIPKDEATIAQKAAAKAARADELAGKISENLNELILDAFMAMGMPTEFIYKPGRAPASAPVNSPYTDLGAKLTINPMTAKAWGRFAAELESTELGGKLVGTGQGSSTLPLILSGLFALGSGAQYFKGVAEVLQNMQRIMQAKAQMDAQQSEQSGETNG
jgi:hypothetical protein